ncbi:MAG: EamA family transporter, partial [Patescibacteria group bacterium]
AGTIIFAVLLWSMDGVIIRPKFYTLPASLVVFLEHAFDFIVLSPFIWLGWRRIKNLTTKDWGSLLWICIFGGLIGTIMITKAFFAAINGEVTFATVVLLQKLQPIFALVLARLLLGERLPAKFYGWAAVAIAAAYVLAFGQNGINWNDIFIQNRAALFALLAAFSFGSSTVFGKRIVNHLDFKSVAALRFGITAILALILVLITDDIWLVNAVSPLQWQLFGVIVVTSGATALFFYYYGLRRVTASAATICELFWPVSAVALDYFINRNTLTPLQITASSVLLLAVILATKEARLGPIKFSATTIPGRGTGRVLGFPTANLDKVTLDMEHGVYVVKANFNGQIYNGLLHFGYRETFDLGPSLELYLSDFAGNLYGVTIAVEVIKRIRDVKKFSSAEELQRQIREDLKELEEVQ